MTYQQLHYIFVELVGDTRKPHGDFLQYFAKAYLQADGANAEQLKGAAEFFVAKYNLDEEYLQDVSFCPTCQVPIKRGETIIIRRGEHYHPYCAPAELSR